METVTNKNKRFFLGLVIAELLILLLMSAITTKALAVSIYDNGYKLGCADGKNGNTSNIGNNKFYVKNTARFNEGYNDGFNACSKTAQYDPFNESPNDPTYCSDVCTVRK